MCFQTIWNISERIRKTFFISWWKSVQNQFDLIQFIPFQSKESIQINSRLEWFRLDQFEFKNLVQIYSGWCFGLKRNELNYVDLIFDRLWSNEVQTFFLDWFGNRFWNGLDLLWFAWIEFQSKNFSRGYIIKPNLNLTTVILLILFLSRIVRLKRKMLIIRGSWYTKDNQLMSTNCIPPFLRCSRMVYGISSRILRCYFFR